MRDLRLATRYAGALVAAAKRAADLNAVAESYAAVRGVLSADARVKAFLEGPQVAEDEKKSLLRTLLDGRVEPVLLDFFLLLIDRNRIEFLDDIGVEFARLVEVEQGIARAHVVTAVPLPTDLEPELVRRLETLTGARIVLEKKVDPFVIAGVCVTVGDRVIDGTVRAGLRRLRDQMLGAPLKAGAGR
jgi:F-type H+-transporting ATPase subunit delta